MQNKYSELLRSEYKNKGLSDNDIIEDLLSKYDQFMGVMRTIMETELSISLGLTKAPEGWNELKQKLNLVVK